MKRTYPVAHHIVVAYNINSGNGFQDDDEHGVGWRIHKILMESVAPNTVVFLVRNFGEELLWKQRYELAEEATKQALFRIQ